MRIIHVVTLVTPNGAFGGPVTVAVNCAKEQIARGHEVTLVGLANGYTKIPSSVGGVPARLYRATRVLPLGFSGLTSIQLMHWLCTGLSGVDIAHVHLARDLVTLPAALILQLKRIPYLIQPHGMVVPSKRLLAQALDLIATRRVLRYAAHVCYLTNVEAERLSEIESTQLPLVELRNGVSPAEATPPRGGTPNVLFLGRLHPRKRPLVFVEAAIALLDAGVEATFSIVGPDEGEAAQVEELIGESSWADQIVYEGSLPPHQINERIRASSILLLPSIDEPYPMAVIEAMALGRPVVITDSCGLSPIVEKWKCGTVTSAHIESVTEATAELLSNRERREEAGRNARDAVAAELSISGVVDTWLKLAQGAMGSRP